MNEVTLKEFEEILDFIIQNGLQHSIMGLGAPGVGGTGKYLDLEVPDCGVFLYKDSGSIDDCRNYSAELLYNEIEMTNDDSANCQPDDCSDCARQPRGSKMVYKQRNQIFTVDQGDLIFDGDMDKASEQKIKSIIYKATEMVKKQRGTECSLLVERILAQLKPSRIKWDTYLKRFFYFT